MASSLKVWQLNHIMGLETFIIHYGYIFILLGTFFEGETVLVLAGFLVHQGYLSYPLVIASAFAGTFAGDQLYFHIGRTKGMRFLDRYPSWNDRANRAARLLQRYQMVIITGFRFIYGIRTVTPFLIGASGIPTWRFMILNALGGIVWASGMAFLGYLLGHTAEVIIEDIKRYEYLIMVLIVMTGSIAWLAYILKRGRRKG